MSSKQKATSSSRASDVREKATDKLDVKEFRDRFCIPNGVIVELLNGGAPLPSAGVVQGVPAFYPDSSRLHSPQHRPGADGMQHYKHVVQPRPHAAGVFFVYSLKKVKMTSSACPLTCPPSIGDGAARLDERRGEGTRGGPRWMGGVLRASGEALLSKLLFSDSGSGKKGPPRGLGGKGVFCLSQ
ncbi:hypothetical protein CK203_085507 [Vitis vinifera]|uniref:Uncharacterized protein n=1 Tax=Vitis vinifera TaxID=29760 RepID=A0A438C2M9_VITVI|nr:hypothetical protein CK203_085507 [Vitis vinifera]